jgi:hypothetical protein
MRQPSPSAIFPLMYEYRVAKVPGRPINTGRMDEEKIQKTLDDMAGQGWRLVSSFVEMLNGVSVDITTIWEREKK